jgi:DNA-directed RNA polymerase alpha subunit
MDTKTYRKLADLLNEAAKGLVEMANVVEKYQSSIGRPEGTTLSVLALSVRARGAMKQLDIGSVEELCATTADHLLEAKNFGVTNLWIVREALAKHGLYLFNEAPQKEATHI